MTWLFFDRINDIIEGKVKYNSQTEFKKIAEDSLRYLRQWTLMPKHYKVDDIWGHAVTIATIQVLYDNYIESEKQNENERT